MSKEKKGAILIVDDVVENIQVLGSLLRNEGYNVYFAQSGFEALELVKKEKLDLILLDVMMPGLGGFETAQEIGKIPGKREIPILFITALSEKAEVLQGFSSGGVDYITKPFHASELLARVKTHLGLRFAKQALREKNRRLEETTEKLREANLEKEQFFSILAHDLRNPFNALLGLLGAVIEDYSTFSEEEIMEMLHHIHGTSSRVYELLLNLLAWGKSKSGQQSLKFDVITVQSWVSLVMKPLQDQARNKGISLINHCPKGIGFWGNEGTMSFVLRNLLSNGIKFTPKGGKVEVFSTIQEGKIWLQVKDNGLGIKEEDLSTLFRLDSGRSTLGTEGEKGTGLGLPLVKEYIEKNKGSIEVRSKEGEGTIFQIQLPLVLEDQRISPGS